MLWKNVFRRHRSTRIVLCAAAMLLGLGPLGDLGAEEAKAPLRFGLIAVERPDQIRAQWEPLLTALSERLGTQVVSHAPSDYAGVIWAMRDGHDQLAWFGNKSAIEAVDNADGEVFARLIFQDGETGYHSLMIVRAGLSFKTAEEVLAHAADLTLGSGDPNSTSGYLIPGYYLFARNGVDPRKAFRRVITANHETNILAVAEGRTDAAMVASNRLNLLLKQHPEILSAIRVVWRSPEIPSDPLVWRKDLPAAKKDALRAFFLDYGTASAKKPATVLAAERRVLAGAGILRFIASDNRQLVPVRQVEMYRSRMVVEADPHLEDGERRSRLANIDRMLADIERQAPAN